MYSYTSIRTKERNKTETRSQRHHLKIAKIESNITNSTEYTLDYEDYNNNTTGPILPTNKVPPYFTASDFLIYIPIAVIILAFTGFLLEAYLKNKRRHTVPQSDYL